MYCAKIAALDQPHVDIQSAIDLAEAVDGHHMWVGQARRYARLAPEALLKLVVFCQMAGSTLSATIRSVLVS